MTNNEIIQEIVLEWLDFDPDYSDFIESIPDDVFEELQDDDDALDELFEGAKRELKAVRDVYQKNP